MQNGFKKRQQEPSECPEVRPRAKRGGRVEEQPQQPAARIQCQSQQSQKYIQRKQHVQRRGEPQGFSPHSPQKIVNESQRRAKPEGRRKLKRLKAQRQLHQPNRRAKKPPVGAGSS